MSLMDKLDPENHEDPMDRLQSDDWEEIMNAEVYTMLVCPICEAFVSVSSIVAHRDFHNETIDRIKALEEQLEKLLEGDGSA